MSASVPKWPSPHFRCSMSSTSWWQWMTFVVLRSQKVLGAPSFATETVRGSFLLSGVLRTGSLSAPHQVCSVTFYSFYNPFKWGMTCDKNTHPAFSFLSVYFSTYLPLFPSFLLSLFIPVYLFYHEQDTRVQTLTGQITWNSARPRQLLSIASRL